jgi:hypothetical protein
VIWFEHAVLRLAVEDREGYRDACRRMIDRWERRHERDWLVFAAHACALAPGALGDQARVLGLAEQRLAVDPRSDWSTHVLGLALYRAGRSDGAIELLAARTDGTKDAPWDVLNWLVLAMAHHRLGRDEAVRHWLDRADQWVSERLRDAPGGRDRGVPPGWNWRDGIIMHLLQREAQGLVARSTELPPDPFARP